MFNKHPKGLIPAALSNMGERFGYYIMDAVLVLFLCSKFGISEEQLQVFSQELEKAFMSRTCCL